MQQHKVGIYIRTAAQDEDIGHAIQAEVTMLKNFFIHHFVNEYPQFHIVKVYEDIGQSGVGLDRPGLNSLLADAEIKKINVILMRDVSRISRNMTDVISIYESLKSLGCAVISMEEKQQGLMQNKGKLLGAL